MVVIYTQDKTIIRDNADAAKADLISLIIFTISRKM